MNYLEIDKASRDKIANVIDKNFFVEDMKWKTKIC